MDDDRVELAGVKETMLFTLYCRDRDNRSRQPVLGDSHASRIIDSVYDRIPLKLRIASGDRYVVTLRARRLDGWTREFLATNPDAVVLHLACGLDSRAFRLDVPATVDWIDLDFPEIIELRRQLYPPRPGYRVIAASVTDPDWLTDLPAGRPLLVIAEGLLMYLPVSEVKALLHRLTERFPKGQMIFDVIAPWIARVGSLSGYRMYWGIDDPHQVEKWNPRLSLMDDAPIFCDYAEVPLNRYRVPYHLLSKVTGFRNAFRPLRFTF
ncbi:class I SAM-dependent methyltransferase [Stackebrandtia nassauensis]|uniref:O-methyltransferase domain protein n=1 Tax=Stackebrandtia nassauensis (strain DSM 44728 / CIP 108903 / NRRL B-16338 / NBRC 102104 / LLR-40K-21) TaxID=446470 RepID=D3Q6Y0_STANL|nr:class I SAM-dependent methyltransferase [Stackebrandtia nassauensis]ADD40379.1 O-methyltransferase domain protein [Stackebrandtia nassauensis DSM 44728]